MKKIFLAVLLTATVLGTAGLGIYGCSSDSSPTGVSTKSIIYDYDQPDVVLGEMNDDTGDITLTADLPDGEYTGRVIDGDGNVLGVVEIEIEEGVVSVEFESEDSESEDSVSEDSVSEDSVSEESAEV